MSARRTQVALYAFMPYGAPELLESEQTHMGRALFASSVLVPALLAAAFLITGRLAEQVSHVVESRVVTISPGLLPPPPSVPYDLPRVAPAAPSSHTGGDVVPVVDSAAQPDATVLSQEEARTQNPGQTEGATHEGVVAPPVVETVPLPDSFVYADEYPTLVTGVKPDYPAMARDAGVEGTVVVLALIGKDGRVLRTQLAAGGSVMLLDEVAQDAVRRFVFTPALSSGHPVLVWVRVPVTFKLH